MRTKCLWAPLGAVILSFGGSVAAQDSAEATDADARAAQLFENGNRRFDEGDLTGAEAAYEEAFALKRSFDIAANLGAVELDQGKSREAAEHFAFALSTFPASGSSEKRAALEERLDTSRKKIGTLAVTVDPAEAELTVDGKTPNVSPYRSWIFVEPGRHRIEATRPGFDPAEQEYVAHAGQIFEVSLVLHPSQAPVTAAPQPAPADAPSPSEGAPLWPAFVGAGLTLALVGVGVGFTVAGSSSESDADARRSELADQGVTCPGGCPELVELYGDADSAYNTGVVFFVASGVVAAATLGYLFLMPTETPGSVETGASLTPTVGLGPDGAAAGFVGTF